MIRLLSRLAAALLLLAPGLVSAATVRATPATLPAVLAAHVAGDVVQLAPGSYGDLVIQGKGGLTVEGPREAVFRTYSVVGSSDVTLKGFSVDWTARNGDGVKSNVGRIANSNRVSVIGLKQVGHPVPEGVAGALYATTIPPPPMNSFLVGYPAGRGLTIEFSENVTVSDTEMAGFFSGISTAGVKATVLTRNHIHHGRTTNIKGGAEDGLEISFNRLGPASPWRWPDNLGGDHLDGIHIFTGAGRPPLAGLVIKGNLINNIGGYAAIGILIGDNGGVGIPGAIIQDNLIVTGNTQGISFSSGVSAILTGNNLIAPPGSGKWPTFLPRTAVISAFTGNTLYDQSTRPFLRDIYPENTYRPKVAATMEEIEALEVAWLAKHRPAPAAPADPRDVRIAELEQALAKAEAAIATLTAEAQVRLAEYAALATERDAIRTELGAVKGERDGLAARIAAAKAALD